VILLIWAIAVLCLTLYAVLAKHKRQDRIAARAVAALAKDAESGTVENSDYLYGFGWQGPMVDLIQHHRHYPEMERVMLLMEARRVFDWIYLYPNYKNADMRESLITHCLRHFPDDPEVHWAVGRLRLIGGQYGEAADELKHAMDMGFDPRAANVPAVDLQGRHETALILAGRLDDVLAADKGEYDVHPTDDAVAVKYFDLLCKAGEYDTVIDLTKQAAQTEPLDGEFWRAQLRAELWGGHLDDYRASAPGYVAKHSGIYAADTRAMLSLLDHDYGSAVAYAGAPPSEPEWWSEWLSGWRYYRLLADAYAVTGDTQYVAELDAMRDGIKVEIQQAGEDENATWEERQAVRNKEADLISIAGQKARAHALRGEWPAAADALGEVDPATSYRKDSAYEAVSALVALSKGEALEEHSLGDLASTGAAVLLLLSPELASAAQAGGMSAEQARNELLSAISPERDNFWWYEDEVLSW